MITYSSSDDDYEPSYNTDPIESRREKSREKRNRRKAQWARKRRKLLQEKIPVIQGIRDPLLPSESEEEFYRNYKSSVHELTDSSDPPLSDASMEQPPQTLDMLNGPSKTDSAISNVTNVLHGPSRPGNSELGLGPCETSDEESISKLERLEGLIVHDYTDSDEHSDSVDVTVLRRDAPGTLWDELRTIHFECKLTRDATNRILRALSKYGIGSLHTLPLDCRTLTSIAGGAAMGNGIFTRSGVEYYYFGVESQIKSILRRYPLQVRSQLKEITISQNLDGIPLFKSSGIAAWPLLMQISNIRPRTVFPAVIGVSKNKPQTLEYLEEAIKDLADLLRSGIEVDGIRYQVKLGHVICDAPARALAKNVVTFNASYGCDQCTCWAVHDGKRLIWTQTNSIDLRTDESFRLRQQPQYHKGNSVFEMLPLDMVEDFPIDFMHQAGGTMRKLISWNVEGPRKGGEGRVMCRMSPSMVSMLDNRLRAIQNQIPNCFARKARPTTELQRYKFTELRQLLLYTGKIAFHGLMASSKHYKHLCSFNVACSILVDDNLSHYLNLSELLLQGFVKDCIKLYGTAFMVYNVHAMLHLPRAAKKFGALDAVSAWPFENYLGKLKKHVKSGNRPIVSLKRGCLEEKACHEGKCDLEEKTDQHIATKRPNNSYVDMDSKSCFDIVKVDPAGKMVHAIKYLDPKPFFKEPVPSDVIGCFKVVRTNVSYVTLSVTYVKTLRRAMRIDLEGLEGWPDKDCKVSVFNALYHETCS